MFIKVLINYSLTFPAHEVSLDVAVKRIITFTYFIRASRMPNGRHALIIISAWIPNSNYKICTYGYRLLTYLGGGYGLVRVKLGFKCL